MRTPLRLFLALGAASAFGVAFLVACSEDTSVSVDTEAGADAQPDSPKADTGLDSGLDTSPPFDGGFVVSTFDTVLATELCKSLSRCCYGTETPGDGGADGGTFDNAACITQFEKLGFQGSNLGTELRDGGNVVIDQVSADDCVNKVKALTCDVAGPAYSAARAACFAAYSGVFAAGHACKGAVECQRGHFCKGELDGGPGVCTALRGLDGGCGDNPDHPSEFEESCSYRGGGDNGSYCNFYDFNGAGATLDAGDWKCATAPGVNANCTSSVGCKDTICDPIDYVCKTPDRIFDQSCTSFLK